MSSKEPFSVVAIGLTLTAFYTYIRPILRKETYPHVFTWFIWGAGTVVVFFAQLQDGAGVGAWPIGISGIITLSIALLALSKTTATTIVTMD